MSRLGIIFATLAGAALSSHTTQAEPLQAQSQYVGDRSNNSEQETYASVLTEVGDLILAFTGPARMVGTVTGDPEKDTVAYKPFLSVPRDGRWSFRIDD